MKEHPNRPLRNLVHRRRLTDKALVVGVVIAALLVGLVIVWYMDVPRRIHDHLALTRTPSDLLDSLETHHPGLISIVDPVGGEIHVNNAAWQEIESGQIHSLARACSRFMRRVKGSREVAFITDSTGVKLTEFDGEVMTVFHAATGEVRDIPEPLLSGRDEIGRGMPEPDEWVAVEEMPVLQDIPAPEYPVIARQAGIDGTVLVRTLVGKDGAVREAFVVSGRRYLDEPALAAVRHARFTPAQQGGRPVAVWVQVPMRFTLDSSQTGSGR